MRVKLARHTFSDDPSWVVVSEDVPLGTVYEVLDSELMIIKNVQTGQSRRVPCYLLRGNGGMGYMPTDVVEGD